MSSRKARRSNPESATVSAPSAPGRLLLAAHEWPFLGALALAPWVAGGQDPLPALWMGVLLWIAMLVRLALAGSVELPVPRLALLWAFPALAALSLLTSANRGATVVQTLLYASWTIAAVLAADGVRRPGGAARMTAAVLAGAMLVAAMGAQEYGIHWRAGDSNWRAFSRFTNPNFFAGYVVLALMLELGVALHRSPSFKPWTWLLVTSLLAATLGAGIVLTGSRGALLASGFGLALFLVAAAARGDLRAAEARFRAALLVMLLAVTGACLSGPLRSRQAEGVRSSLPPELCHEAVRASASESSRFRLLTWHGAINMGCRRPLLGWGAGSFETAFAPNAVAGFTRHAHSGYLQLFAEGGAVPPLIFASLVLMGAIGLVRLPRDPEFAWAAGACAALGATATHNVLDSILFVPAAGLLTWTLIGAGLAHGSSLAPTGIRRRSMGALVVAVAGLLLTLVHVCGRTLLEQGRRETPVNAARALQTLAAAQRLLPWDHQVAVTQSMAYRYLGQIDDAVTAAQRAINLAPERPPGYRSMADLRVYQGNLPLAERVYHLGLQHAPREVELQWGRAKLLERLGWSKELGETYRAIAALGASPAGQVRPLGEIIDPRFAQAHFGLAREAERAGRQDEALAEWKAGACGLGERRGMFDNNPGVYFILPDFSETGEREVRLAERAAWERVAGLYEARGEKRLAEHCREQAGNADASLELLRKAVEEFRGLVGEKWRG